MIWDTVRLGHLTPDQIPILDWDSILILDYLVIGFSLELQASDFRFPDAIIRIQSLGSDSWIFRISRICFGFQLDFRIRPLGLGLGVGLGLGLGFPDSWTSFPGFPDLPDFSDFSDLNGVFDFEFWFDI